MVYTVTIGGTSQNVSAGSLVLDDAVEERSILELTVEHDGICTPGSGDCIVQGHRITVTDGGTTVFDGFVEDADDTLILPDGDLVYHAVTAKDFHYLADRRIVAASYQSQTVRAIIRDLITNVLSEEGVSEDTTAGSESIPKEGLTLTEAVFNYASVSRVLDALAERAGWEWWIAPDRTLHARERGSLAAPFDLTWDQIDGGPPSVTHGNPKYRNVQYLRGGIAKTDTQTDEHLGDGKARSFAVGFPIAEVPTVKVDGVAETVGIRGIDTGKQWYWSKGSPIVFQDSGESVLTSSNTLTVEYKGQFSIVAKSVHDSEVDRIQTREGTGSGKVEHVFDDPEVQSQTEAFDNIAGKLSRYARDGVGITFATLTSGLQAGQTIGVTLSEYGWSGESFLIARVVATDGPAGNMVYTVSAVSGPIVDSWARFWADVAETPSTAVRVNIAEEEILALLATVDETWSWSETVTETVNVCSFPASDLYPGSSLYPC